MILWRIQSCLSTINKTKSRCVPEALQKYVSSSSCHKERRARVLQGRLIYKYIQYTDLSFNAQGNYQLGLHINSRVFYI
jgi:hypothetical protein